MRIELKCKCGSSAVFQDDRGRYINTGGARDDKGRKYIIEVRADEWLKCHRRCIEGPTFGPDPCTIEKLKNMEEHTPEVSKLEGSLGVSQIDLERKRIEKGDFDGLGFSYGDA
ncbi:MAG: hypothetical protein SWO11_18855 [Thermodesulfobacteriota bacterium]|nr:hypothetical protein [Thermodesulfobacteriota bacterium]